MVPELLILALDYYRAPLRYPHLASADRPLPESFDNLIAAFACALSPRSIESTAHSMSTSPAVIRRASVFFLRQVLMAPGSDHYRVLGLSPDASAKTIREHYRFLVRIFHPDRSDGDVEGDAQYTARINDAYSTLRRRNARERYDRQLAAARQGRRPAPPRNDRLRPGGPVAPNPAYRRAATRFRMRNLRPWLLLAVAGLAAAVVVAIFLWTLSTPSVLRSNPKLADPAIDEPSFLRRTESSDPVLPFTPSPEGPPAIVAAPARDGAQRRTNPAASVSPNAASSADQVVGNSSSDSSSHEKSRDEIRSTAIAGLDPYPEALVAVELETPEGKARFHPTPPSEQSAGQPQTDANDAHSPNRSDALASTTRAEPPSTRKDENETEEADQSTRDAPALRPAITGAESTIAPSETNGRALQSGAADAQPAKVPPTPSQPKTVAESPPVAQQQTVPARASPKKDQAKTETPDKTPEPRQARTPTDRRPVAKAQDQEPIRGEPPNETMARRHPGPDEVIARLTRFYRAGDLQGLVSLFTADARVKEGSGISFIRSDYANFFARTAGRRLSIRNLDWQRASNGNIVGRGTYRAGTKDNPDASWHYSTGTLQIELSPGKDGYRISKLMH